MTLREAILVSVNSHQGMKGVDLVLNVMGLVNCMKFTDVEYQQELESLLKNGEVVELEYILPQLNYRIKSMYFPKGTVFNNRIMR